MDTLPFILIASFFTILLLLTHYPITGKNWEKSDMATSTTTSLLQFALFTPLILTTLALVINEEEMTLAQPKFCRKYQVQERLPSSTNNN